MCFLGVCTSLVVDSPLRCTKRRRIQRLADSPFEQISSVISSHPFLSVWFFATTVGNLMVSASASFNRPVQRSLYEKLPRMQPSELRRHNGINLETIYVAADGLVFDVTSAKNLYGPDGDYAVMAGRDASRMLARGVLQMKDTIKDDDDTPLSLPQRAALKAWIKALESKYKVVACLENRADFDLIQASAHGDAEQVRKLIFEMGADPRATDGTGDGAIHMAALSGDAETCRIILNQIGAEALSQQATKNRTPLHFAAENSHKSDALHFLIEAGAQVTSTANDNWTPLHAAAQAGNGLSISALCNAGANINALSDAGVSPLIAAATFGHFDACRILLNYQADATLTVRNKSAADWAQQKGHIELAAFLRAKVVSQPQIN